jgi:hemerythrin superfamily protein
LPERIALNQEIPMPSKSTPKSSTSSTARSEDATKILVADHKEVKALFKQYEKLADAEAPAAEREAIATEICTKLTAHATVEEELFYPAAREALSDDDDLVDEAAVEHATAKDLIAQIEGSSPDDDPLYDAKVKVLGEYIDHHVKEEEDEMFPKVRKSEMDLLALGLAIADRKQELLASPA